MFRRFFLFLAIVSLFPFLGKESAFAEEIPRLWRQNLTLKYEYRHFQLNLDRYSEQFFRKKGDSFRYEKTSLGENPLFCSPESTLETQNLEETSPGEWEINMTELKNFLTIDIAPKIDQESTAVTISKDEKGNIVFDGFAQFGQKLDIDGSALLIAAAAQAGLDKVTLAVEKTAPEVTVNDPDLKEQGISELVSVGWSKFDGSPANRRHNIAVGSSRFAGVLIPQGETFSFNTHLGPVNGATGYLKELVIVGPTTVPEYGGGLCQVSSTTYRGAMIAGLPIVERRNHSFSVRCYAPEGSDATIYPGSTDLRFLNDTPGALLLQTRIVGDELFFHYYGTRDERKVYALGPYTSRFRSPPAAKYTTSIKVPVGEKQKLSDVHPGLDASWFRLVEKPGETFSDEENGEIASASEWQAFFSRYQSRGLWVVTGVTPEQKAQEEGQNSSDPHIQEEGGSDSVIGG